MSDKGEDAKAATPDALSLRVVSQDGGEVHFKVRSTTMLSKLIDAYCDRQGVARDAVRFLFDGARLSDKDTPKSLGMEEGDSIDAVLEQTGGWA